MLCTPNSPEPRSVSNLAHARVTLKASILQLVTCSAICKAQNGPLAFLLPYPVFYSRVLFSCFSPSDWGISKRPSVGIQPGKLTSSGLENLPSLAFFFFFLTPGLTSNTSRDGHWAECNGQEWQQEPGWLPPHLKGWAHCPLNKEEEHL